jgi:hypothetical protein
MAQQNVQLTAENVRDRLEFLGFSLKKYSNALASIHTVIRRLLEKGEIDEVSPTREAEKTAYIWRKSIGRPISKISNAPPPPRTL